MSTPSFLNESQKPGAKRPRRWAERAFLTESGLLRYYLRVLLFIFCVLAIQYAVVGFVGGSLHAYSFWMQLFWTSVALAISFFALSWFFVRIVDYQKFSMLGLTFRSGWATELGAGLATGFALQLLVLAILAMTHSVHYAARGTYDAQFWKRVAANVLLFAVAATVEELAFRGYALRWGMWSVGTPAALVISAIIFGVAHGTNPNATFFSTLNTALAGILLALPYVRTHSMWMQIGLHWSWNFALATIVSLPVSGINFGPSLFTTTDVGPHWLTGGNYGPEGGAAVTIVCVLGIAWLISTRLLKPSHPPSEDLQWPKAGLR